MARRPATWMRTNGRLGYTRDAVFLKPSVSCCSLKTAGSVHVSLFVCGWQEHWQGFHVLCWFRRDGPIHYFRLLSIQRHAMVVSLSAIHRLRAMSIPVVSLWTGSLTCVKHAEARIAAEQVFVFMSACFSGNPPMYRSRMIWH